MAVTIKILVPIVLYVLGTAGAMVLNGTSKEVDSKGAANSVDVESKEKLEETKDEKRLSVVDWAGYDNRDLDGPGTYAFGYDIEDAASNNVQFRSEERHQNGTISGSYGYLEPDGNVRIVHYNADEAGFRAHEENSRRGMLKPIIVEGIPEATKIAGYSDKMLAALQSQKVHQMQESTDESEGKVEKVQKVHEERTRPKDQYMISSVNTVPVTVAGYTLPPQKVHETVYPGKILTAMSSENVYVRQKLEEKKQVQKITQEEYTTPKDQYVLSVNALPVTYVLNPLRPNAQINYRGTDYFYYIPYPPHY